MRHEFPCSQDEVLAFEANLAADAVARVHALESSVRSHMSAIVHASKHQVRRNCRHLY